MTTNPTDTPPSDSRPDTWPDGPAASGPRVGRDDVRDLGRLRRSRGDRRIAGVAGGLARHLDIDPIITRVLLVVLVFFGGAGILLYAAVWLVVPSEGTDEVPVRLDERSRTVVLIVVGAIAALAVVGDTLGGWGPPWPVVVAGLVVLVVLLARGREPRLRFEEQPGAEGTTGSPADRVRSERRRGPVLFWYAIALIAVGTGVLGIVDAAGVDVPGSAYPAVALGTCAALLLLGAFWGRAGGLILLGLVAALATAGATAAAEVDAGRLEVTPTTAAAVQDRYDLTFGEIDVDLTEVVDPENLDGRTVEVELDVAGRILVTVPDDLDVTVRSRIEVGERRVLGDRLADGDDVTTTYDGGPDAPQLTLDVRSAFGEIVIDREGARR